MYPCPTSGCIKRLEGGFEKCDFMNLFIYSFSFSLLLLRSITSTPALIGANYKIGRNCNFRDECGRGGRRHSMSTTPEP